MSPRRRPPVIFTGNAHPVLAQAVAQAYGIGLSHCSVGRFPDGEVSVQLGVNVRKRDVFIIQPTHATAQAAADNLFELLVMIDAARRASAAQIVPVITHFGYARQDRKSKPRVPITAKLVMGLIERAGASRFLSVDLHAAQEQGFTDLPFDHLYARPVLVEYIKTLGLSPLVIGTTDVGGSDIADSWAALLKAGIAIARKKRHDGRSTEIREIVGKVEGCHVIIADDEYSTGGSMVQAARAYREHGAASVRSAATHGKLVEDAVQRLQAAELDEIIVTDTLPLPPDLPAKFTCVSVASLLAGAIRAIYEGGSVSEFF